MRWALRRALVDERDGPLPAMLVALTCLAGVVDATSILALDHVFVAAVTGNIVFLGIALAGAGGSIVAPAVAVGGFVVGALVGARVVRHPGGHRGRAVRDIAAFKLVLAVPVTVVVVVAGGQPLHPAVRLTVTALLAASMGGQLALIRYLKVPDLLTAVLTLTTIGILTERGAGRRDPFVLRRGLALLAFVVGVVAGALLARLVAPGAALTLGLVIILGVLAGSHAVARAEAPWTAPR
ncbi:YoaK family protein [Actinomycetospora lemnae]|uniref:YoaK family protein n=1 Tax=Actinomycetospora lemnae TaxID=3019891 RepID=A0ABT5SM89_9PSEU|nr:YoaK family protein [Actinomycetospora sp. DW7H6]MDD7963957.1 YoaK family protein [Actinomycetospora sp. DW7H6]